MIKKELLSTLKDPKTKAILIVPVFMQSIIFGYVATYDLEKVLYALLELNHSRESTELVAKIDSSSAFERVRTLANANEIANCIDSGEVILVVSIPLNFAQSLLKEKLVTIQVITDGRNTMTASYNPNLITRWNFLPTLMIMLGLVQILMLSGLSVARDAVIFAGNFNRQGSRPDSDRNFSSDARIFNLQILV